MQKKQENKHVVVIIGSSKVGKTQVFNLLSGKQAFEENPKTINGPQTKTRSYPERNLNAIYMDFGPNIKGDLIGTINSSLSRAHKICFVFDISDENFKKKLQEYIDDSGIELPLGISIILIGTKADLVDKSLLSTRQVEAVQFASRTLQAECLIISTKTGDNIDALSKHILATLAEMRPLPAVDPRTQLQRRGSFGENLRRMQENITQGELPDADDLLEEIVNASPNELDAEDTQNLIANIGSSVKKMPLAPKTVKISSPRNLLHEFNQQNSRSARSLGTPTAARQSPANAMFSFVFRLTGMILMAAALINFIYLILIAAHIVSAAALTAGMNQILVTIGGLFGMTGPVASYANACAALGLSTSTATSILSASGGTLLGGLGYTLFRCGKPAAESTNPNSTAKLAA